MFILDLNDVLLDLIATESKDNSKNFIKIKADMYEMSVIRDEFKDSMNYPINGVRSLIAQLFQQKAGPEKKLKLDQTGKLIENMKQTFDKVKGNLENEYSKALKDLYNSKIELNDGIGLFNNVNHFVLSLVLN